MTSGGELRTFVYREQNNHHIAKTSRHKINDNDNNTIDATIIHLCSLGLAISISRYQPYHLNHKLTNTKFDFEFIL